MVSVPAGGLLGLGDDQAALCQEGAELRVQVGNVVEGVDSPDRVGCEALREEVWLVDGVVVAGAA